MTGIFCFRIIYSHYYSYINLLFVLSWGEVVVLFFSLYTVKLCKIIKSDATNSINEYLLDIKYMDYSGRCLT